MRSGRAAAGCPRQRQVSPRSPTARCSWKRDKGSSREDRWAGSSDTCVLCLSWPRGYGTLENE